jgi:hypothetical protein
VLEVGNSLRELDYSGNILEAGSGSLKSTHHISKPSRILHREKVGRHGRFASKAKGGRE